MFASFVHGHWIDRPMRAPLNTKERTGRAKTRQTTGLAVERRRTALNVPRMKHLALPALIAACLATACVPKTRTGATATTIAGATLATVGAFMLADLNGPGDDTDGDGVDEFPDNDIACALGGCAIAGMMLAAGLVTAIVGVAGLASTPEVPIGPDIQIGQRVAYRAVIDPRILAPLPEIPADAETIRLAQQARGAARHGQCDAAAAVTERIRDRHPRYAAALETGPALAPCQRPNTRR